MGGMLVNDQKPFGIFAYNIGVCRLEYRRGSPGGVFGFGGFLVPEGVLQGIFQRNKLARFGL